MTITAGSVHIGPLIMAIHIDSDGNFYFGASGTTDFDNITYTPVFSVTKDGVVTAQSGTIGGWTLGSSTLTATDSSNNSLTLNSNGTISANYSQASTGYQLNADGSAEFNGPILHLGNTVSGTPGEFSGKRLNIGNSFIFDLGNQGLTISTTAVRASKYKAIAIGTASNPPISIQGDYAELGFFATNDTSVGGFTTMHATNGTSDVFHWNSTGTNVTFHGNVTIEGSQISVNGDTGGNNQFLGYNSSGTLGFHSVSTGSHNHDGDYVDTVSGSTDALTISGRNITLNFGETGTRVARGNHDHDGDYATSSGVTSINSQTGSSITITSGFSNSSSPYVGVGGFSSNSNTISLGRKHSSKM